MRADMSSSYNISKVDFLSLSKIGQVVPVFVKVFGGTDTPVGIYEKLSAGRSGTLLLESAEQGVWSRYSCMTYVIGTIDLDLRFLWVVFCL
jgi:anthranilate synthase component 1